MNSYGTFAAYYDALTKNVRYAERADALDRLIRAHLNEPMPEHILVDLACGTGSLSEEMAKRGWDVIGIDGSADMLNEALDKKYDSGLPIQYLQQDMRALDLYGTVCVTLCTLDSINHLPSVQDVKRVFARVSLFAEPGGLFVFDVNTAYKHRKLLGEQCFVYELPEAVCVWQNHLTDEAPEYPVEIQLDFFEQLEGNKYRRITEQFTERVYSDEIIRQLLAETGLTLLDTLDGDTYGAPTPESERLLYIARKA
ncbi:MAG: class I SAM-dependent methyltransferase [Oscillospiraceae bacterium]|nr:class I SAM-dependent methyltransferase [Oscillospiraceae bacterium]